jgi:hypothetical protein
MDPLLQGVTPLKAETSPLAYPLRCVFCAYGVSNGSTYSMRLGDSSNTLVREYGDMISATQFCRARSATPCVFPASLLSSFYRNRRSVPNLLLHMPICLSSSFPAEVSASLASFLVLDGTLNSHGPSFSMVASAFSSFSRTRPVHSSSPCTRRRP